MTTQLKEAIASYAGPLSTEQIQTLRDMQGWIEYCIANGFSLQSTLGTLSRDINALLADGLASQPKVAGYAKYRTDIEDLSDMANDVNPNDVAND